MKPFLILQLRPIDIVANDEFGAILGYSGLASDEVHRVRMEKTGIPSVHLDDYSGVILGGGPANVSDAEDDKSPEQLKFETDLSFLFDKIIEKDFPFLGVCYGIGAICRYLGGEVSKERYSEGVGVITVKLNGEGQKDDLLSELPKK